MAKKLPSIFKFSPHQTKSNTFVRMAMGKRKCDPDSYQVTDERAMRRANKKYRAGGDK